MDNKTAMGGEKKKMPSCGRRHERIKMRDRNTGINGRFARHVFCIFMICFLAFNEVAVQAKTGEIPVPAGAGVDNVLKGETDPEQRTEEEVSLLSSGLSGDAASRSKTESALSAGQKGNASTAEERDSDTDSGESGSAGSEEKNGSLTPGGENSMEIALAREKVGEAALSQGATDEAAFLQGKAGEAAMYFAQETAAAAKRKAGYGPEEGPGSLVMANVTYTLNVRSEPDEESSKVGYLYADCGGTVLERKDGWTRLKSGDLTGWAKDDYLLFGEDAMEEAGEVGRMMARVMTDTLRIRKGPSQDAGIYDLVCNGETFEVVGEAELEFSDGIRLGADWAAISYEGRTGYVSSDYVKVEFEYDTGETLEEIAAREAKQAEEERKAAEKKRRTGSATQRTNSGGIPAGTTDVMLLAALIQCEAGGESYEGQVAVGAVVVNRVRSASYPNSLTGVIYASGQFSPAGNGRLARTLANGNVRASCVQAANEALAGVSNVGGATHFRRAGSVDGIVIGNHVFW